MNHRQWKKKFKKVHGRNPYPYEDKKVVSKTIRYNLEEMYEAIANFPKILARTLAGVAEVLSEGFANMADALRRY